MEPVGPIARVRYGRNIARITDGHESLLAGDSSSEVEILNQWWFKVSYPSLLDNVGIVSC